MNLALGTAGVVLGLVGLARRAVVTMAVGLVRRRPDLRAPRAASTPGSCCSPRVLAVFAMERALITRDFTVQFVAEQRQQQHPAAVQRGHHVVGARGLDPAVGAVPRRLHVRRRPQVPRAGSPTRSWAGPCSRCSWCASSSSGCWSGRPTRSESFSPPSATTAPAPTRCCRTTPLMAFHPPMLYLGYVGFTVPFAFAIAALVTGRVGEGWLVETRRWTLVRLGLPHRRHRARRVVELRGARLGRLLGLGPGRERLVPAVAHRHRLPALGDGAGAARHAAGLEPVAAVRHLRAHHPGHVPHPLGRARVSVHAFTESAIGPASSASSR